MKTALTLMIAGFLSFSVIPAAVAETSTLKPSATVAKPDSSPDEAKKAKAKECSDQADAKKLHGEARKAFRAKCKKS